MEGPLFDDYNRVTSLALNPNPQVIFTGWRSCLEEINGSGNVAMDAGDDVGSDRRSCRRRGVISAHSQG